MIIGTFNGWNIVALPPKPGPSSVQLSYSVTAANVTSPYSQQMRSQIWPGADLWTGTVSLPPMYEADFEPWNSFLMELQGITSAFQLRPMYRVGPLPGVANKGTPVVVAGVVGSNQIQTSGWPVSMARVLLVGDLLQIGYRLYKNTETVTADASGNATLTVYPSLREAPTAGAQVILNNPKGLFRLAMNKFDYSVGLASIVSGFSFPFMEAR